MNTAPKNKEKIGILPPAVPGSRGDQAMVEGLLSWLDQRHFRDVTIFNPERFASSWKNWVSAPPSVSVSELRVDLEQDYEAFLTVDKLIILGADVIDGSCGEKSALVRFAIADRLAEREIPSAIISFSFSRKVAPSIISAIKNSRLLRYFACDSVSQSNFHAATGIAAGHLPDLGFLAEPTATNKSEFYSRIITEARDRGKTIVALNFSSHGFAHAFNIHDPIKIQEAIAVVVDNLARTVAEPFVLVAPHDTRRLGSLQDDISYAEIAAEELDRKKVPNCVLPALNFSEMLSIAKSFDICVSGRMHLAIACIRSGVPTIVFRSNDKLEGFYKDYFSHTWELLSPRTPAEVGPALQYLQQNQAQIRASLKKNTEQAVAILNTKTGLFDHGL